MNEQEITIEELQKLLPEKYFSDTVARGGGRPIPADEAAEKIAAYHDFISRHPDEKIKNQTWHIEFDSEDLINYLIANRSRMDQIRVCMSLDKGDTKFNVVLWPLKRGWPALTDNEEKKIAISPYNIGNRRP